MLEIAGGIILAVFILFVGIPLLVAFGWVLLGLIALGLFLAELYVAAIIVGIIAALWGSAMCAH